ncbi:hypothetical protein RTP6_006851 [Batrachochytrium dendrobatidis]
MTVIEPLDRVPVHLTPVKRRTHVETFNTTPKMDSLAASPIGVSSEKSNRYTNTVGSTPVTDNILIHVKQNSKNVSSTLTGMLALRARLVLSDLDRTRFKKNAAALCVVLIASILLFLSGYDAYPLRYPATVLTGSILFFISVFLLNIIAISAKYLWPDQSKSTSIISNSTTQSSHQGYEQSLVESRGEAWSPVRPLVSPRKVYTSPRSETENSFNNNVLASTFGSHLSLTRNTVVKPFMLRGSPMRKEIPMIHDRMDLNSLLDGDNQDDQLASTVKNPFTMSLGASTSTISQFQHAVKPTVNLMDKEIIEDGLVVREPTKTLKEWKTGHYIDKWAEEIRKWLATHLLAQLVERIDAVDQLLTTAGLSHLSCSVMSPIEGVQIKEPVVSAGMTNTVKPTNYFGLPNTTQTPLFGRGVQAATQPNQPSAAPQTLQQLADQLPLEPMVKERVILEGYLAVGKYSSRDYIIYRIKVLATGSCLAQYKWNGGQTWKGKQWNHDVYPSDAEIIMHLFCKYLDEKIMILEPHKYRGFTDKHFLPSGAKPSLLPIYMIREQSKWPAHYQLVVENTIWDLHPNRNNLFHTLAMFIYCVKVISSGYIGLLYIGGVATQLLDIVAYGPIASKYDWPSKIHGNKETELLSSSQLGSSAGNKLKLTKSDSTPLMKTPKRLLKF